MRKVIRSMLWRGGVVILSVALALWLNRGLNQWLGVETPFLLFLAAVAVSARYAGLEAGLLATALAAWTHLFLGPAAPSPIMDREAAAQVGVFVLAATLISGLSRARIWTSGMASESEAWLEKLPESSTVGIVISSPSNRLKKVNGAFLRMLGYAQEDLLSGKVPWIDLIAPEYIPVQEQAVQKLRTSGICPPFEAEYIHQDGHYVPVLVGLTLLPKAEGHYVAFIIDLTERKQAESALREDAECATSIMMAMAAIALRWAADREAAQTAQAHFRVAAELASDAFISIDHRGNIIFWSRGAQALFGYGQEKVLGQPLTVFMPARCREAYGKEFERVRLAGPTDPARKAIELYGRRADGREFPLELVLAAWKAGEATYYTGVIRDMTARRQQVRVQAQIVREQTERAEAAERRATFLAMASERLATSLDYATTLANVTHLAVPHLADWCIIDVAQESGSLRRRVVARINTSKKVERTWEVEQRHPKDSNPGHGPAKVLLTGQPEIYFEIPEAMFTAIAQDSRLAKTAHKLGLKSYMCVPLQAHGKTLGVISLLSAGSGRHYGPADLTLAQDFARHAALAIDNALRYRKAQEADRPAEKLAASAPAPLPMPPVSLPKPIATRREEPPEPDLTKPVHPGEHERPPEGTAALAGVRVLIVDDEADARAALTLVLAQRGAKVRACTSAAEALTALESWDPDVLISDIDMPGQDGFALIRQIRTRGPERSRAIPAIALTVFTRGVLAAGFQAHLSKPVDSVKLVTVVAHLAGRNEEA